MRLYAILPLLCTIAALVLSLLCLFAGSNTTFLPNAELLTLNASRIGHTPLFNVTNGKGGFFSSILNSLEGDINNLLGDAASDIARAFDIHDFYAAHIMNFCEGYYEPNATVTNGSHKTENVTYCSNRTAYFHFDPAAIITSELAPGLNLTDLKWPNQIQEGIDALETASKVMFVFYIIGIIFTGFAFFGALFALFTNRRLFAFLNSALDFLAFLCLGVASAISTAVIVKAVNTINHYGSDIGIAAYKGSTFLGMTWAATGVMLVAALLWLIECCIGRGKHRGHREKAAY